MRINLNKLHATYLQNTQEPWTGVLPVLAAQLGVSERSLQTLGVGFAPAVTFEKKNKSTTSDAWWVIPERDAEAKIVGLSLRLHAKGSVKPMLPGSKHGLIYPVRPDYRAGAKPYKPGAHNWVRTMDAGLPCPICGKPDGCLLSDENPADPKAVMCIRESKGAVRPGDMDKGGWLHHRKPEARITTGGPLPESEHPVLIVEGMSDTAAALDMGLVAVGRPSNCAGIGYLRELLRGRTCIVLGENDDKWNEKVGRVLTPGKDGVESVFESLKNTCSIRKLFPPEQFKDFRVWKQSAELTLEQFLAYAAEHGSDQGVSRTLDSKEPVAIATRWLREEHTLDGVPTLRKFAKRWYCHDGRKYAEVDEEAFIRGGLYRWLLNRDYINTKLDGTVEVVPYEADKGKISNIIDALSMDCPLQADPPCWLDGRTDPPPKHLVAFPNGVLDVHQYLRTGVPELIPLSPLYFSMNVRPYDFDPDAKCPTYDRFLSEALARDVDRIHLADEWAGLLNLPNCEHQKMLIVNGPSGTGKTTWAGAIAAMLGEDQCCRPTLSGLGQEYALAQAVGKLAMIIGDGQLDPTARRMVIMERLKELTGSTRPMLMVRRMQVAEEAVHIYARVMLLCNELPDLPDSGGALPRRTLALPFMEKFDAAGSKPDRHLPDKLAAEAAGIFNRSLLGLDRLQRNGFFTIPKISDDLARKFASNASPIAQFASECCDVRSDATERLDVIYDAWRNWARENGLGAGMKLKFSHNLRLTLTSVQLMTDVKEGRAEQIVSGLRLSQSARDRYLAR